MAAAKSYSYFSNERNHSSIKVDPIFEFDEADVWNLNGKSHKAFPASISSKKSSKKLMNGDCDADGLISFPVNIPAWSRILNTETEEEVHDNDHGEDEDHKMPPHEYLLEREMKRRTQNQVACSFSVHEGRGRTLKGRDLSRVRNAVWENIGFQD